MRPRTVLAAFVTTAVVALGAGACGDNSSKGANNNESDHQISNTPTTGEHPYDGADNPKP